jgi:hypothetical protein
MTKIKELVKRGRSATRREGLMTRHDPHASPMDNARTSLKDAAERR